MNKKKLNQKGSFSYFMIFIVLGVVLIFLFAIGIPFAQTFQAKAYEAAQPMFIIQQNTINKINDVNVKAAMQANLTSEINSIPDQSDVLSKFFQYGWILIIIIITVILFLYARRQVETGTIG